MRTFPCKILAASETQMPQTGPTKEPGTFESNTSLDSYGSLRSGGKPKTKGSERPCHPPACQKDNTTYSAMLYQCIMLCFNINGRLKKNPGLKEQPLHFQHTRSGKCCPTRPSNWSSMSSTSRSLWLKIVAVKLKHDLVQQPAGGARGLHMLHKPEDLQCRIA